MTARKLPPGDRPLKTLERVLSKAGIGSRREARSWIAAGRATVNGQLIRDPDHWVDLELDRVAFDGKPLDSAARIYLLLHKPVGYLTTYRDPEGRPTVYDLLPEREDGPVFRQGDVIPINMTSIPIQTEDLLRELDAVLRSIDTKALGTLIHELGTGLRGHGKDLSDAVKALDIFTRIGAERSREITGIIGNAADVQDSFNSSSEDFVRAVSALRTVLETLAARRADLERTLSQTKGLNGEIIALLESKRQQINTILADLGNTVRITHARLGDVDQLLTYLGPFLNDAAKAFDTPYYVFNLVTNDENPECRYDPSGRPARPVTDDSPKPPTVGFKCPSDPAATTSGAIRPLSTPLQVQLDRISWVYLFTLGL